ncbi:MAG: thioredoxin family protein [Acidiferrobacterales bacterium]|nr:thioredoxin family protein [Acidiferrobacterales bacterium]
MRIIVSLLTLVLISCCALSTKARAGDAIENHEAPHEHLVGEIDKSVLLEPPYQTWFEKNYTNYSPDKSTIKTLEKSLDGIRIQVFMGTWCHDSQREVPRLFKILENSGFDLSRLDLVSLNRDKKTPNNLEEGLNIQRTPTFVFIKNGIEIGRIVETPRDSIENDILKIVSGQEYKHSYHGSLF